MKFLDANIFLRYITRDDEAKASDCAMLIDRVNRGAEEATTSEAILTEVVYVLSARSHYGLSPTEISARLRPLVAMSGLRLPQRQLYLTALDVFASYPFLDFEDALTVAYQQHPEISEVTSYDRDFDRVPGVHRREPPVAGELH